jgi:hypothetical protein
MRWRGIGVAIGSWAKLAVGEPDGRDLRLRPLPSGDPPDGVQEKSFAMKHFQAL